MPIYSGTRRRYECAHVQIPPETSGCLRARKNEVAIKSRLELVECAQNDLKPLNVEPGSFHHSNEGRIEKNRYDFTVPADTE